MLTMTPGKGVAGLESTPDLASFPCGSLPRRVPDEELAAADCSVAAGALTSAAVSLAFLRLGFMVSLQSLLAFLTMAALRSISRMFRP